MVLGARSAVFAPLPRLGLVVVDEEHESSYKQDGGAPRYDARQVAFRRAEREGAVVVYGSATPRPETWHALPRLALTRRADGAPLPAVQVVDMRTQGAGPVSRPLADALRGAADRGEKAILLLNRRGFARMALCRACGWIGRCPRCDVSLVVPPPARAPGLPPLRPRGAGADRVPVAAGRPRSCARGAAPRAWRPPWSACCPTCAGCGWTRPPPPAAAPCRGCWPTSPGPGRPCCSAPRWWPRATTCRTSPWPACSTPTARWATPTSGPRSAPSASSCSSPGGPGGAGEPARVIVQALEPAARAVRLGAEHDVEGFLAGELERRRERGFPPFGHLVRIVVEGEDAAAVPRLAAALADDLRAAAPQAVVLGPAPLHRLQGRTRRALLIRADRAAEAALPARAALDARAGELRRRGLRAVLDVDPQNT